MRRRPERWFLSGLAILLLAGAASAGDPARLSLHSEPNADGSVRITAHVTDAAGAAVSGAPVTFTVRTAFGWLTVAEVEADAAGDAAVVLPSRPRYPEVAAQAAAAPEARAGLRLADRQAPAPIRRPGSGLLRGLAPQPGFLSPYPVPLQVVFLTIILGGIWTTYGYLVSLLIRIRRAG